jgi:uncharacterized protein
MSLKFTWDEHKARSNLIKHGVSFEEATSVFDDPLGISIPDPDRSDEEEYWIGIGRSYAGKSLVVWYVERGEAIRIIGCRRASRNELRAYEEGEGENFLMEMREEYDFSGGERGRHFRAYRAGHTVEITKEDGTVEVHHFKPVNGSVIIDPDLRERYPDSAAVNRALRSLAVKDAGDARDESPRKD